MTIESFMGSAPMLQCTLYSPEKSWGYAFTCFPTASSMRSNTSEDVPISIRTCTRQRAVWEVAPAAFCMEITVQSASKARTLHSNVDMHLEKYAFWKGLQLHTLKVSPFFWDLVTLVSRSTESLALGQRMRLPSHLMKIVFISVISSTCTPSYFLWDVGKDLAATNATRKGKFVPPASAAWTDTARQRYSVQLAVAQAGSYRAPVLCGSEQDHIAHVERPHYEEVHHALIDGADAVPEHKDKREQQTGHSQPGTCQIHLQSRQLFLQHSLRACAPWQRTHVHKNIL